MSPTWGARECNCLGTLLNPAHTITSVLTVRYHSPTRMWAVRQYGNESELPISLRWFRYKVDAVRYVENVGTSNTQIEIYNIDGVLRRKEIGRRVDAPLK